MNTLSFVFLCMKLTKSQTNTICGPDLAHEAPIGEKICAIHTGLGCYATRVLDEI